MRTLASAGKYVKCLWFICIGFNTVSTLYKISAELWQPVNLTVFMGRLHSQY